MEVKEPGGLNRSNPPQTPFRPLLQYRCTATMARSDFSRASCDLWSFVAQYHAAMQSLCTLRSHRRHSLPSGRCPLLGPVFHPAGSHQLAWRTI